MPLYSGQYDEKRRAIVSVFIAATAQHISVNDDNSARALLDTGSGVTCLSQGLIDKLGLRPRGKMRLLSSGGEVEVFTYSIVVCFPIASRPQVVQKGSEPPQVVPQEVSIHASTGVLACECTTQSGDYEVVLGMDVLQNYIFLSQGHDFVLGFAEDSAPPPDSQERLPEPPPSVQVH